jgi:hypothetical protein
MRPDSVPVFSPTHCPLENEPAFVLLIYQRKSGTRCSKSMFEKFLEVTNYANRLTIIRIMVR